jgi:uncharacterized protein (DUF1810 family)
VGHVGGMGDPFDLDRFIAAQDAGGTWSTALSELRAGHKRSHWMWFVFPQLRGLGRSPTAHRYGVTGLAEARAYLAHPVLGPRLLAVADAVAGLPTTDPVEVVGAPDAVKLRSSMTLFAAADPEQPVFRAVLDRFFGGVEDAATTQRLLR